MKIFCTAITGAGEEEYISKFVDYCKKRSKNMTPYPMGKRMFEHLLQVGVKYDPKRILNVPYQTRKIAVGGAFEKVIADMQDRENIIINSHSKFLWKKCYTRANSWHYIKKVDPDVFVTFIDAEWRIKERLEKKGTYAGQELTTEDILMWQNNEVEDTAGWAEIMGKPHYVFATNEPPSLLYSLIFEPHKELIYASFPMSFIKEKKDVDDIDTFVEDLRKYFAVISPRTIEIGGERSYTTSMHTIHRDLNWYLGPETKIIIAYFPKIVFTKGVSDEIKKAHDDTKKVWWIFPTKSYGPFEDFSKDKIFYSKDEFFKYVEEYVKERDRKWKVNSR
jgi:hypothetical protein